MENDKTFIVAELSANHNGSLSLAKKTIAAAKEAGADAVNNKRSYATIPLPGYHLRGFQRYPDLLRLPHVVRRDERLFHRKRRFMGWIFVVSVI